MGSCHLTAEMIEKSLTRFTLEALDILIIENVGNLICPVAYRLGESVRMVVVSITEGADKPLKYPAAFASADCAVITKIDLEPYVEASVKEMEENILAVNPRTLIFRTSARNGTGIDTYAHFFTRRGQSASGIQTAQAFLQ
jgi:hydrogenase nickel incorporation protein HypB